MDYRTRMDTLTYLCGRKCSLLPKYSFKVPDLSEVFLPTTERVLTRNESHQNSEAKGYFEPHLKAGILSI
jgi:hypothetical protein